MSLGVAAPLAALLLLQPLRPWLDQAPAAAFDLLQRSAVDVLVSDISMPGEDGYRLVGRLRELERAHGRAPIPAIAVTGHASVEDREHAVAVGFQLHVPKPIDPEELATVVALVASRAAGA
jgi:hypothetical protein